ncbi:MAG: putative metal-binding motif-containing protein [Candidatus Nanoarchaeia archaeon]|nr:putative metal-binding motif-containing protein [Candidatus Nanoarchaeia archaeon]
MKKRGILSLLVALSLFAILVLAVPDPDEDGDGYCPYIGIDCPEQLDCNDNNPEINPGATETPGDGIDNDCNGIIDDACTDSDRDGYNAEASVGGVDCGGEANVDCDDANMFVNPGMAEICGDGIDNDCDGNIDEEDSDCAEASVSSSCEMDLESIAWISCDVELINSANEGDTVYMIAMGEGCDDEADVTFKVYEYSDGTGSLEDTITAQQVFTNIPDEDGIPTNVHAWIAPWVAAYIEDDDGTDPEYYFKTELRETSGAFLSAESGKTEDTLLTVLPCDECLLECTLDIAGMLGMGNGSGSGITPPCQVTADCSGVAWSECDTSTGKMTRDTSLCTLAGTGTVECQQQAIALAPSERLCSTSANPSRKNLGFGEAECGDGICDEGEDCPEDCGEPGECVGFWCWWWWILIAIIIIGVITTGIIIMYNKKKKEAAGAAKKPEEKKEVMPFAAQKDLDAILAYIRAAKGKGYNDAQITDALKKAGWKDDQIKYAFNKINNPQQANAQGAKQAAQKPAQTTSQQAAQPVKK